jgi:hypothetical protein
MKKFLVALLLCSSAAWGINVNSSFGPISFTSSTGFTWSVSTGSQGVIAHGNLNMYMLASSAQQSNPATLNSATWNGVPFTALPVTSTGQGGGNPSSRAWLLELTGVASATTANFVLANTTAVNWVVQALVVNGVDPFTPHGANNANNGTAGGQHNLTVTTQYANSLLLDILSSTGNSGTQTFTFSTSWTASAQTQPGSNQSKGGYAYLIQSGTNAFNFSQTVTGGGVTDWSDLVQEIAPIQPTATNTPTFTASPTPTSTRTNSFTASPTSTFTASPTATSTASPTPTFTASPTSTITNTFTASPTPTETATIGIVGFWQGNSTPGRLIDSSGAGNTLVQSGNPGWPTTPVPPDGDHWLFGLTLTPTVYSAYAIPPCAVADYTQPFTLAFFGQVLSGASAGNEGIFIQNSAAGVSQFQATLDYNSFNSSGEFLLEETDVNSVNHVYYDVLFPVGSTHFFSISMPGANDDFVQLWIDGIPQSGFFTRANVSYGPNLCQYSSSVINTSGKSGVLIDAVQLSTNPNSSYLGPTLTYTTVPSSTPTWTVSPTPTITQTFTRTQTYTASPTNTPSPSASPTATATSVCGTVGQLTPIGNYSEGNGFIMYKQISMAYPTLNEVATVSVYVSAGYGPIQAALYTDYGGQPNDLVETSNLAYALNPGWNVITFSTNFLGPGTYWIAVEATNTALVRYADQPGPDYFAYQAFGTWPAQASVENQLGNANIQGFVCGY